VLGLDRCGRQEARDANGRARAAGLALGELVATGKARTVAAAAEDDRAAFYQRWPDHLLDEKRPGSHVHKR
jgi:hypothetical protein